MDLTLRMQNHAVLSRAAAAAGMVLLKNLDNTLPFTAEGTERFPLAVFGAAQLDTPAGGTDMTPWRKIGILDGLLACDALQPDGLLAHKYRSWVLEHPDEGELPLSDGVLDGLAETCRGAVVCIGRTPLSAGLQLTQQERDLLERVCARFPRTVLVLATPGYLDIREAAGLAPAVLWMGLAGQEGGYALADLLTAKVVPSGHLAHTWPADPAAIARANACMDGFVGYRYYEAFSEDVLYPFGHGLTYGAAELRSVSAGLDGYDVTVSAEVENTGAQYPVQETVQVYEAGILRAFARSRVLLPGERELVQLRFPVTDLAVFHEDASAFVLEEGYHEIQVGTGLRSACTAASIRLTRSVVVRAVTRLKSPDVPERTPGERKLYPEQAQEQSEARRRAIRLSDRNLPRVSLRKGREFTGCRSDGNIYSFIQFRHGECSVFSLTAGLDDESLRALVNGFGTCEAGVPGGMGATCRLERYDLPAIEAAGGSMGLRLTRDVENGDGEVVRHQYTTLFPAASLLACTFDPALIRRVGRAIGTEMQEFGVKLWLAPGLELQRDPAAPAFFDTWSEDPLVAGLCGKALAEGVQPFGAAILCCADAPSAVQVRQKALRETLARSFEIACGAYRACLLPVMSVNGESVGEDSALIRSLIPDWHFTGAFLSAGERYCAEPDRATLEKSALRILRLMQELA